MTALLRTVKVPTTRDVQRYSWFAIAAAYVLLMSVSASFLSWDIWAAIVIAPILFTITLPIMRFALRKETDPRIHKLVVFALLAKLLGAMARYALTFELYGRADADEYHRVGGLLARGFWDGNLAQVMNVETQELTGTAFIKLVTGFLYLGTGPTKLGGFVVFSWLSFLGLFAFFKALSIGFPEANRFRYGVLLFFLPSLVYWPSSLGKEAWMCFALGITAYGVALILRHQPLGYPVAGLGLLGTGMPRPHITALCVASLLVAYALRRKAWNESKLGPVGKFAGIVVLLGIGAIVATSAASFFELNEVNQGSVTSVIDYAGQQSSQGGSEFEAARVKSPAEFPGAALAVLFRPYPWEAGSAQALLTSFEGLLLLILCAASATRLLKVPSLMFRVPYVAFCVSYVAMFILAFSSIGNFGIMTRQRTQVMPFLLVLLAIPLEQRREQERPPTLEERARYLARAPRGAGLRS
jgi:hypothetical protein